MKRGYVSAADFAKLFNKNDLLTACGAPWTPLLCTILIRLVASFNLQRPKAPKTPSNGNLLPRKKTEQESKIVARSEEADDAGKRIAEALPLNYSQDEIAGRLKRIGRAICNEPDRQGKQ